MRSLIILGVLIVLKTPGAFAADACGQYLSCGTYTVNQNKNGKTITNQIIVAGAGDQKAFVEFIEIQGSDRSVIHVNLTFNADGSFTGKGRGPSQASGFCGKGMCTFALTPMETESQGAYGITGVLRFLKDALEYNKFVATESGPYKYQTVYQKE